MQAVCHILVLPGNERPVFFHAIAYGFHHPVHAAAQHGKFRRIMLVNDNIKIAFRYFFHGFRNRLDAADDFAVEHPVNDIKQHGKYKKDTERHNRYLGQRLPVIFPQR